MQGNNQHLTREGEPGDRTSKLPVARQPLYLLSYCVCADLGRGGLADELLLPTVAEAVASGTNGGFDQTGGLGFLSWGLIGRRTRQLVKVCF